MAGLMPFFRISKAMNRRSL